MLGGCIVTGSLEAEICTFAERTAGSPRIMSHSERCATLKVRSSKYPIHSNWMVHSLLIVSQDPLIAEVSVFISLGPVSIL